MTAFEIIQVGMLFCSGIGVPVIVLLVSLHHKQRSDRFDIFDGQLAHIDDCLDKLRVSVLGNAVMRSEMDGRLLSLREKFSSDTNALHERLLLLESASLAGARVK